MQLASPHSSRGIAYVKQRHHGAQDLLRDLLEPRLYTDHAAIYLHLYAAELALLEHFSIAEN
jgi:hypothetical protein